MLIDMIRRMFVVGVKEEKTVHLIDGIPLMRVAPFEINRPLAGLPIVAGGLNCLSGIAMFSTHLRFADHAGMFGRKPLGAALAGTFLGLFLNETLQTGPTPHRSAPRGRVGQQKSL